MAARVVHNWRLMGYSILTIEATHVRAEARFQVALEAQLQVLTKSVSSHITPFTVSLAGPIWLGPITSRVIGLQRLPRN